MFHFRLLAGGLFLLSASVSLNASTILTEGFDNVSTLAGSGWTLVNRSSPLGTTGWFQGNTGAFNSHAGAPDAYIAANYLNADGGNISNWLITPVLPLQYDLQLSFYTRTESGAPAADRLQVRLSTNGTSSDVGASATSVGDFTNLLLTINPALDLNGYPQDWTQYTVNLAGMGAGFTGRFALRYDVTDTTVNGDYIGVDTLSVNQQAPEPATLGLIAFALGAAALRLRIRRAAQL
jgi:hypothetical protein